MQVQIPIFIFCLLLHAGIYQTSARVDCRSRLIFGLVALASTWVVWYLGQFIGSQDNTGANLLLLARVLVNAPYYVPFLSFLVYIKR